MRLWETHIPIPNMNVKTKAADGTWRETARESRWMPEQEARSKRQEARKKQETRGKKQERNKRQEKSKKEVGLVAQQVRAFG